MQCVHTCLASICSVWLNRKVCVVHEVSKFICCRLLLNSTRMFVLLAVSGVGHGTKVLPSSRALIKTLDRTTIIDLRWHNHGDAGTFIIIIQCRQGPIYRGSHIVCRPIFTKNGPDGAGHKSTPTREQIGKYTGISQLLQNMFWDRLAPRFQ